MSLYEWLNLKITSISALCVAGSLFYLAQQIRLFIKAHQDNHDWNRRIETQHALNKVRELNTDALNIEFGFTNRKSPIPLDEILAAFEKDIILQQHLHRLLNFYEGLANGIFSGIYDEKIIKVNRYSPMKKEFTRCQYYIDHRRKESNRTAWSGYERLMRKWEQDHTRSGDLEPTGNLKS